MTDQLESNPRDLTLRVLDIPPSVRLPPRVEHLLVKEPDLLSNTISKALDLPQVSRNAATHVGQARCLVHPQPFSCTEVLFATHHSRTEDIGSTP